MTLLLIAAWLASCAPVQETSRQDPRQAGQEAQAQKQTAGDVLKDLLAKEGIKIDKERKLVMAEGKVTITADFLEFVAIGAGGKKHEALVTLECKGSTLNAALLALGLDPKDARNVDFKPVEPPPTQEEVEKGAPATIIVPPRGPRLYLGLSWHDAKKVEHTYAIEDLILDVRADDTIRNCEWIYIGGLTAPLYKGEPPVFVADYDQNYISTYYTKPDSHLITIKHERGRYDENWWPHEKLLPAPGTPCTLVLSTAPVAKRLPPLRKPDKKKGDERAGGADKRGR